jgi:K+-sensing histidine kinase KdpD
VQIAVCDNGQGIRSDFLPFVFDRFRQADQGPTRQHGGLGLGWPSSATLWSCTVDRSRRKVRARGKEPRLRFAFP